MTMVFESEQFTAETMSFDEAWHIVSQRNFHKTGTFSSNPDYLVTYTKTQGFGSIFLGVRAIVDGILQSDNEPISGYYDNMREARRAAYENGALRFEISSRLYPGDEKFSVAVDKNIDFFEGERCEYENHLAAQFAERTRSRKIITDGGAIINGINATTFEIR